MQFDLEYIYRTYRNNIYGIGFNYFRNESDANDKARETFNAQQVFEDDQLTVYCPYITIDD